MAMDFEKQATGDLGGPRSVFQGGRAALQEAKTVSSTGTQILTGLAKMGSELATKAFISETENLYIEGMRQRQLGTALADVESNVFTKPFLNGGYHDQDYRIKQAEFSTKTQKYIEKQGKRLSPEKFQEYLREQTGEMFSALGAGMSAKGRAEMVESQMSLESTLLATHSKAYQENIMYEVGARFSTDVNAQIAAAKGALSRGEDVSPHTTQLVDLIDSLRDTFPPEMANTLTTQALKTLYDSDLSEVVDPIWDIGRREGVFGELPLDMAAKISTAKNAARERGRFAKSAQDIADYNRLLTRMQNGDPIEEDELNDVIKRLDGTAFGTEDKILKLMQVKAADPKAARNMAISGHYARRNFSGIMQEGASIQEAGNLHAQLHLGYAGEEPDKAIPQLIQLGIDTGSGVQKPVVDAFSAAMNAYANSEGGQVTEYHAKVLGSTWDSIKILEGNHKSKAIADLSRDLPPDQSAMLEAMIASPRKTVHEAMSDAATQVAEAVRGLEGMSSTQKAKREVDVRTKVAEEVAIGSLTNFTRHMKNWLGKGDPRPTRDTYGFNVFEDLVLDEATKILKNDPLGSAEVIAEKAYNAAEAKTMYFRPEGGDATVLVMPHKGDTNLLLQGVHGVQGADGPLVDRVEKYELERAMVSLYKPDGKGQQLEFETDSVGNVFIWQRDKVDNSRRMTGRVDPVELAKQVRKERDDLITNAVESDLGGAVLVDNGKGTKMRVAITGRNAEGIRKDKVYNWRKALINREGYRSSPYEDGGRLTAGIGHQLPEGTGKSGFYSEQQVEQWFLQDTEKALTSAVALAERYGFEDDTSAVLGLAGMVFQLGEAGASEFDETFRQVAAGRDWEGLVARSKTWKWNDQTEVRVKDFLESVKGRFNK